MHSVQEQGYEVTFFSSLDFVSPEDENIDVHVSLDDGGEYIATFFSLRCVERLMLKFQLEDDMPIPAFWESSPIIVEEVTEEAVCALVEYLVQGGELPGAFELAAST